MAPQRMTRPDVSSVDGEAPELIFSSELKVRAPCSEAPEGESRAEA